MPDFDPDAYLGLNGSSKSGPGNAPFKVKGFSYKGLQMGDPEVQGEFSGASSGASTAASEAAREAARKKRYGQFYEALTGLDKPLGEITEEDIFNVTKGDLDLGKEFKAFLGRSSAPEAQSAEKIKLKEIVRGGVRNIADLRREILGGNRLISQMAPFNIADPYAGAIIDDLSDQIGRLRSGGAINEDEEARFKRLVPGGLTLGKDAKIKNLGRLEEMFLGMARDALSPEEFKEIETLYNARKGEAAGQSSGGLTPEEEAELQHLEKKYGGTGI